MSRIVAIPIATLGLLIATASQAMADNEQLSCFSCAMTLYGISIIQALLSSSSGVSVPSQIAAAIWPLVVVIVGVTCLWSVLKCVAAGVSPIQPMLQTATRMAVLSVILTSSADIGQLASDYLIVPALSGGASLGAALSESATNNLGASLLTTSCTQTNPARYGITDPGYTKAATHLLEIVCRVQSISMVAYSVGSIISKQQLRTGTSTDLRLALVYSAIGILMTFAAMTMLIDFSLSIFETLIRLAAIMAFLPITAIFWVYPSTRGAVHRSLSSLLHAFVYLTLTGIATGITVFLLATSFRLGLGNPYGPIQTPTDIVQQFANLLTSGGTVNDGGVLSNALIFMAYTAIGTLMSFGVQRGIHGLAAEMTLHSGASRSLTMTAMGSINSVVGIIGAQAVGAATTIGRAAGTALGSSATRRQNRP